MKGKYLEELEIGMSALFRKKVRERDIVQFAELSGDTNPLHLDENYAAQTMFKGRIAHGMLTASYISAALGTQLPGPGSVYISQILNFKAPVRIEDEVVTEIRVEAIHAEKSRVTLSTICRVQDKIVLEGEAILLVPRRSKNPA